MSHARFYGITQSPRDFFSSNKDKYNIWGKYNPNTEVYMTIDGKKSKTTRANPEGWFTFEKVKITKDKSWLHLYEKQGRNAKSISEKTQVNLYIKKMTTEYDIIHNKQ